MTKSTETLPDNNMDPTIANESQLPVLTYEHKDIPIARIIELRNKQLTYQEIANLLGCTKENICQRLRPYKQTIDNLKSVKEHRADTLTVVSSSILNSLTEEDIKKSSAYQKVGMFGVLYDKERLERGQVTEITGHAHISGTIQDLMALARERGLDTRDIDHPKVVQRQNPDGGEHGHLD